MFCCLTLPTITRARCRLLERLVNISVYLLTVGVEAAIIFRYYLAFDDYLVRELSVQLAIISTMTPLIFISLYKASNTDPGKVAG